MVSQFTYYVCGDAGVFNPVIDLCDHAKAVGIDCPTRHTGNSYSSVIINFEAAHVSSGSWTNSNPTISRLDIYNTKVTATLTNGVTEEY